MLQLTTFIAAAFCSEVGGGSIDGLLVGFTIKGAASERDANSEAIR